MREDVADIEIVLGNGVRIETQSLGDVECDPNHPEGDVTIVSHAHTDHLPSSRPTEAVVASELTGQLAAERRGWSSIPVSGHPSIDLLPAGHIAGSRAALIHDDGRRILYTGDVCTRDRPGIVGFDPVPADVLIVEATYGTPEYRLPPISRVVDDIRDWIDASGDVPLILYGYSIGRAQRIIRIFETSFDVTVRTTETIRRYNEVISGAIGRPFATAEFEPGDRLAGGEALLVPHHLGRTDWMRSLVDETGAVTAGFTGWALDSGYRYRRGVDAGFPLSDHCDFPELLDLVASVDPAVTYIQHGFTKTLARELARRGFDARALVAGQSTLDTFA